MGPLAILALASFVVPAVTSLVQGGKAKRLGKEVDSLNKKIPLVDPQQMEDLSAIQRRQRALEAGTDPMTAARMRAIQQAGAQVGTNLARASGGSGATLVSNVLRAQNQTNAGIQEAGALASNRADTYQGMQTDIVRDMAQRKLGLLSYMRDVKAAEYAQARQGQQDNLMAAIGSLPNIGMGMAYDKYLGAQNTSAQAAQPPSQGFITRAGQPQQTGVALPWNYQLGDLQRKPAYNYGWGYAPPAPAVNYGFNY